MCEQAGVRLHTRNGEEESRRQEGGGKGDCEGGIHCLSCVKFLLQNLLDMLCINML